jgi:putative DNA primase/helicase
VAAAGELASAWGITGWETGAAIHAAGMCFRAWLERRGGAGPQEDDAALAQVRHFIELHGEARFSPMDGSNRTTINRAGFRRTINGAEQYLILPEVFRREVCAGFDYRRVAHLLLERGFLETEPPHLTLKPRGIKRVYCVREEVLA